MKCPQCDQPMAETHQDISTNSDTGQGYKRRYFVCKADDIWLNLETPLPDPPAATIIYTNWRGETAKRRIRPLRVWFGHTQWHPDDQWLLTALDIDKNAERDFALKDITTWHN